MPVTCLTVIIIDIPVRSAGGGLHGIQQPPARGLRVFAEPVLAHEQRVVARVVADEAAAKAVPRAIRLERRRLLLGVEVDVLALPGRREPALDLDDPRRPAESEDVVGIELSCIDALSASPTDFQRTVRRRKKNCIITDLTLQELKSLKGEEMTYGYIRVSSDKQTVENQRFEINNFCERQKMKIDGWIEETISGTKNYNKRELGKLLKRVQKDDLIICAELSRLGRNLFMIMEILNICMTKECRVWTIKDNYRLGEDIQSKVLAFAFGLSAEIERNLISQRTKEALARKRAEGVVLGRPKGRKTTPEKHKLHSRRNLICELSALGQSRNKIARICKVHRNTLARFICDFLPELNKRAFS